MKEKVYLPEASYEYFDTVRTIRERIISDFDNFITPKNMVLEYASLVYSTTLGRNHVLDELDMIAGGDVQESASLFYDLYTGEKDFELKKEEGENKNND